MTRRGLSGQALRIRSRQDKACRRSGPSRDARPAHPVLVRLPYLDVHVAGLAMGESFVLDLLPSC